MNKVVLSGVGIYTPPYSIQNEELVKSFNQYASWHNLTHFDSKLEYSNASFIEKASGIKSRFVVEKEGILNTKRMRPFIKKRKDSELSILAEMGSYSLKEALSKANLVPNDIEGIIVACSNLPRPYPATSIEIQQHLGAQGFAFDMNVACSSATFGLACARSLILSGQAKTIAVVSPEICSAHLNFKDRDSHFIFGDACSAMILQADNVVKSTCYFEVLHTHLKTQYSNNIRNNQGFINRCEQIDEQEKIEVALFKQEGKKVFKEVVPIVVEHLQHVLSENQLRASDIKRFWLHQANLTMNQLITKKLLGKDDPTISPTILDLYANTSSAGSIISFALNHTDLKPTDLGIICSFGAGYSVGAVLLRKVM